MFNVHENVTADGVLITEGLVVFTNELYVGTVISDDNDNDFGCCAPIDSHDPVLNHVSREVIRELYTEDQLHPKAQIHLASGWFSDHNYNLKVPPLDQCWNACRHDHWFTVVTANGTKSFNGERIATVFENRVAAREV